MEVGRFGLHAETDRGIPSVLNVLCSTAIAMHRLTCSTSALRALASLRVCFPACLHGETWLLASRACSTLATSRTIVLFSSKITSNCLSHLWKTSFIIRYTSVWARPKFCFLGNGAIALGDCSLSFRIMLGTPRARGHWCVDAPSPEGKFKSRGEYDVDRIVLTAQHLKGNTWASKDAQKQKDSIY